LIDCPVCPRTQIAGDSCPQCGADLKPLLRFAELRSESQKGRVKTRRLPLLAIGSFAVGLAIFPAWQAIYPPLPDRLPGMGYWAVTTRPAKTTQPEEKLYTVRTGDSFWSIAKEKYGMGEMWKTIRDDNKDRLRKRGRLRVGDVIRLRTVTISPK